MRNEPNTKIFTHIYSEPYPIGDLGGTGYAVMRAIEWQDDTFTPCKQARMHDFALIWHQSFNQVLSNITETIYMNGLFSPVQFVGIRGNTVSILVSTAFKKAFGNMEFEEYATKLDILCHKVVSHPTEVFIASYDRAPEWPKYAVDLAGIIPANKYRASTFLRNIDSLWNLGLKPFEPTPAPDYI